jgi:hypothetical protein
MFYANDNLDEKKMMGIINYISSKQDVKIKDIKDLIRIFERVSQRSKHCTMQQRLLSKLKNAPGKQLSRSVLLRRMKVSSKSLDGLLDELIGQDEICVKQGKSATRKVRVYTIKGAKESSPESSLLPCELSKSSKKRLEN